TVKMVLDLAHDYRQKVDADTVVTMLSQLGKNFVAILGATAVTPALTAAVGTAIKTVPGVGTVAGGLMQGLVQALVTKWIGRVFCVYFKNEMKPPQGGLAEVARQQWEDLTTTSAIRDLIVAGKNRWKSENEKEQ